MVSLQPPMHSARSRQRIWSAVGGLAVRMALHSGITDEREGDYFGPAVNRVARLLAITHGGQVVVSDATVVLLHGMMQWGYDKLMAALREQLCEADIEKLAAEGAAWPEDRAVEEALKI